MLSVSITKAACGSPASIQANVKGEPTPTKFCWRQKMVENSGHWQRPYATESPTYVSDGLQASRALGPFTEAPYSCKCQIDVEFKHRNLEILPKIQMNKIVGGSGGPGPCQLPWLPHLCGERWPSLRKYWRGLIQPWLAVVWRRSAGRQLTDLWS